MRRRLLALPVAVTLLAGCGSAAGPASPQDPAGGSPTPTGSTSAAADVFPVVLARTGGIAGFADRLTVQSDGTARTATKRGPGSPCHLTPAALTRLEQAVAGLVAAPPAPTTSSRVSDELVTTVQTPAARGALRLPDGPSGAASVVGELLAEVGGDPAARTLCPPG